MKRPLTGITLVFSLGIAVGAQIKFPLSWAWVFSAVFALLSILTFKKRVWFEIFLSCLIFALGVIWLKNLPKFTCYRDEEPSIVKGFISDEPLSKGNLTSFMFKVQAIKSGGLFQSCCGSILVRLYGTQGLSYGEELILRGYLYRGYLYNHNRGSRFIMNIKTQAEVIRLNRNQGFLLKRFALWLKNKAAGFIRAHNSLLAAAILEAMVLGEKRDIPWFVNNAMMKAGTIHILPRLYTKMPTTAL